MRRKTGDPVGALRLRGQDGDWFDVSALQGSRFMLSFFRFAACPFCNLRVHELVTRFGEFGEKFTVVAVFDSPLDNLQRQMGRHRAPFPILADDSNAAYRAFAIERSITGMLKAALTRFPTVLQALFVQGYLPSSFQGHLATLPADFLVDEAGVIQVAYYGADIGDHLPFEQVRAFARNEGR